MDPAPSTERPDADLDRLVEAERLKTAFLASLSHEFRTPLNVVLGYLDLLEDAATVDEARSLRALIRRHTGSMLSMLDNTLYLADLRLDRVVLEPEVFEVAPLLESVARETDALWGRPAVRLEIDVGHGLPAVCADKRAVRQIVKNLMANAFCFTEAGTVVLEAHPWPEGRGVEISVADTGPGISALDRERLFEEYSLGRTNAPGQPNPGLGIALPVAKHLAALIGGNLQLVASKRWSSLFRFRFPAGTDMAPADAPRRTAADAMQSRGVTPLPKRVHRLPPFPAILGAVARALCDPAGDDRDVRRAVRSDEALSITILNYANSAAIARSRPARTIDDALAVIGLTGLRSLVLTKFVHSLFTRWGCAEEFLWEHALASAIAAPRLHPAGGEGPEDLYLCGLMHNVGKVVLNAEEPARYADVLMAVSQGGEEFAAAEHGVFGTTHAAFGGELVREAAIPDVAKDVVAAHHDAAAAPPAVQVVCRTLLLADAIAYRVSPAWSAIQGDGDEPAWIGERIRRGLEGGLTPETLASLTERVRVELTDMRLLLRR
jgi:HD-like signal output (HDOD) protein